MLHGTRHHAKLYTLVVGTHRNSSQLTFLHLLGNTLLFTSLFNQYFSRQQVVTSHSFSFHLRRRFHIVSSVFYIHDREIKCIESRLNYSQYRLKIQFSWNSQVHSDLFSSFNWNMAYMVLLKLFLSAFIYMNLIVRCYTFQSYLPLFFITFT